MNLKVIARFPTLLEAEAAVTALRAAGVEALVSNELAGSMMPHASDALGGFQVSADVEKEAEARSLLQGAVPEEKISADPMSLSHQVRQRMKRAAYGAIMGCIILPLIANLFSLQAYRKAYLLSPEEFWKNKGLFWFGIVFNLFGFLLVIVVVAVAIGSRL